MRNIFSNEPQGSVAPRGEPCSAQFLGAGTQSRPRCDYHQKPRHQGVDVGETSMADVGATSMANVVEMFPDAGKGFRFRIGGHPFQWIGIILVSGEFLSLLVISILTGIVYHVVVLGALGSIGDYLAIGIIVATLYCTVLNRQHFYEPTQLLSSSVSFSKLLMIWTGIFAVLAVAAFTAKVGSHFSRGAELGFYLVGLPVAIVVRRSLTRGVGKLVQSGVLVGPRIAVLFEREEVGDGALLDELRRYGFTVIKGFPVSNGVGYAEAAEELALFAQRESLDEMLVLVDWRRRSEIEQIVTSLRRVAVPVRLLADRQVRPFIEQPICHVGTLPAVELRRLPLSYFDRALKRLLDVLLAGVLLIALAPLLLLISLLVKLESPGPVFFRQKRIGFNGRVFSILKFRTMRVLEDGPTVGQAIVDDPRVTRLGRWLRRSSFDELPQFINVLCGEMSLVGPRPHAAAHDDEFDAALAHYAWRRNVKPGITGWAQVNGSCGGIHDTDSVRRRVDYDLWYVENWSLWLDWKILFRTVPVLFGARDTY